MWSWKRHSQKKLYRIVISDCGRVVDLHEDTFTSPEEAAVRAEFRTLQFLKSQELPALPRSLSTFVLDQSYGFVLCLEERPHPCVISGV
jgi:hypothetical protein